MTVISARMVRLQRQLDRTERRIALALARGKRDLALELFEHADDLAAALDSEEQHHALTMEGVYANV